MTRHANPKPDAVAKRVVIAKRWWDDATHEVDLIESKFGNDEWEVYLPDGTWIGTVGRYTGSLDRRIAGTRLRHPGKRRTLWHEQGTSYDRAFYGQVSRADCIRTLIREHERSLR